MTPPDFSQGPALDLLVGLQTLAARAVVTVTAARAVAAGETAADLLLLVDATAGPITVTLPAASAAVAAGGRRTVTVKKLDATAHLVTVQAAGADLIDGAPTATFGHRYQAASFTASGAFWSVT